MPTNGFHSTIGKEVSGSLPFQNNKFASLSKTTTITMAIMATDTHVNDYSRIAGLLIRTGMTAVIIKSIITVTMLSYTK